MITFVTSILILIVGFFVWSLCAVAKLSDEKMEKLYNEQQKKGKNNE